MFVRAVSFARLGTSDILESSLSFTYSYSSGSFSSWKSCWNVASFLAFCCLSAPLPVCTPASVALLPPFFFSQALRSITRVNLPSQNKPEYVTLLSRSSLVFIERQYRRAESTDLSSTTGVLVLALQLIRPVSWGRLLDCLCCNNLSPRAVVRIVCQYKRCQWCFVRCKNPLLLAFVTEKKK